MIGHGSVVVVLPAAEDTRTLVGPYAWVVLEHLAARTDPTTSDAAVTTSTRGIATQLALSKDTVTRALRRLVDCGLVHRAIDREATGKFGNATYRVDFERSGLRVQFADDVSARQGTSGPKATSSTCASQPPARPKRRQPAADRNEGAQLSLLDALTGS